ncbi:MAG TPA: hypothetical protein VN213_19830, partial [Solirubrobacteraceae bacterium]|nr:hypothetical protein [Solirubrobacteraceae bacterium]
SVDVNAAAPGLPTGAGTLDRTSRRVSIPVACGANGRIRLAVPVVSRGALAQGAYRCSAGRATATLRLSKRHARAVARRRSVLAVVTLREGAATVRLSAGLTTGAARPQLGGGVWSDGLLQCSSEGVPVGNLVAPNWTATPATAISARAWLAWYRAGSGWHWVGTRGAGSSQWFHLTATPAGVAQWLRPTGFEGVLSIEPWSLGPVTVPLGSGTYVIGAFEAVYWWGGRPTWTWSYVRSSPTGIGGGETYCSY